MPELVALALNGGTHFVDELRRAWDEGNAVMPVDQRLPDAMQQRLVANMGAAAVVDKTGRHRQPDSWPVEVGDALVMATSGSTGEPKGVVLTHAAITASAKASNAFLETQPTDRWLACLPLAHVGGLAVVVRALQADLPLDVQDGFDAQAVTKAAAGGTTLTSLVPTALARINPAIFRAILVGGSAMPPDLPANAIATYGMTETFSGVVYDGWPLAGVEVRVLDGEIQLRGEMLLRCYRGVASPPEASPADSNPTEPSPLDPHGWFSTGDSGEVSPAGKLSVFGRRDEMIITGGQNVWPVAVERSLAAASGVSECAVVGRPHPDWGQTVVAVVVPSDATQPPRLDALREHVKQTLPSYCAPHELELVSEFPRTALGKILRHQL